MPFSPSFGSDSTVVSLSGMSLASTTGVYLISGATRGQCTIISTGNSLITFNPPATPPGNLRSGNFLVFNKFNTGTTTQFFTWINTPYISGITPLSGLSGTAVRISGSGIRDLTGLYFASPLGSYTGVMTDPVFESSTWIRTGTAPWMSGALNAWFSVVGMSQGGSSTAPTLFYLREDGFSLSGITNFPTPIQAYNYLRGNSTADGLEWQTPSQVLISLTGASKSGGDVLTGNYYISGGAVYTTGMILRTSGLTSGDTIFRTTVFSGNTILCNALIGGVTWRAFSYRYA